MPDAYDVLASAGITVADEDATRYHWTVADEDALVAWILALEAPALRRVLVRLVHELAAATRDPHG